MSARRLAELRQIITRVCSGNQRRTERPACPDPVTRTHAARMRESIRTLSNALGHQDMKTRARDIARRAKPADDRRASLWQARCAKARETGECALTGAPVRARGTRGPRPSYAPGAQEWLHDIKRGIALGRMVSVRKLITPDDLKDLRCQLQLAANSYQGAAAKGGA